MNFRLVGRLDKCNTAAQQILSRVTFYNQSEFLNHTEVLELVQWYTNGKVVNCFPQIAQC